MGQVSLKGKHLLGLQNVSPEEIKLILDVAKKMKKIVLSDDKKVPLLKGKSIINLFMEPSTRTRSSFELARSEERRVGKECRIGCRSRWSPYH